MKVKFARNVFVDSEINSIGNGQVSKINFPPSAFNVAPGEIMRMVLSSFEMRRNWYNVNPSNNTFYLFDPAGAGTFTPIVIAQGTYPTFALLTTAIQTAVAAVVAGSTVTYDPILRKYTITLGGGVAAGAFLVCFQVKLNDGFQPTTVSNGGFFNDSQELLGARPTRDNWNGTPVNAFGTTVGVGPHISPFVAALNTLEAIYIRSNLHSGNYQTFGFEKDLPNQQGLTPTQIFARIPLSRAYFDPEFEFVSFEDPNSLFSMYLNQTQLSQVYFTITDDKGRLIQEVAAGQADAGNLSFKMSFRWEVLVDDLPPDSRKLRIDNVSKQYENLAMN